MSDAARESEPVPSKSQRALLIMAALGYTLVEDHDWTITTNFETGRKRFGVPKIILEACQRASWMTGLEITDAGRRALGGE